MGSFLERIKFDKWFCVVPTVAVSIAYHISNRVLSGIIMILGVVIGFIGLRYGLQKKKLDE